jgi:hypothetical protein
MALTVRNDSSQVQVLSWYYGGGQKTLTVPVGGSSVVNVSAGELPAVVAQLDKYGWAPLLYALPLTVQA